MGGSKKYLSDGGFSEQTYKAVGVTANGIKVLEKVDEASRNLPQYSNTPGTVYASLRSNDLPKQITYYDGERRHYKRIDLDHDHPPKTGIHVQTFDRKEPRYKLSKREIRDIKILYAYIRGGKK